MECLRSAGPNERRCIVRQALGYYRTLVIGGTYTSNQTLDNASLRKQFIKALKHCFSVHPILSAAIVKEETEAPVFARPAILDMNNHIDLIELEQLQDSEDETSLVKQTLIQTNDHIFTSCDQIPPWKIVVLPLSSNQHGAGGRYLILFAYYHSHGDGKSGLAFHKTLLSGLRLAQQLDCPYDENTKFRAPSKSLPPTLEAAGKLNISWSFLLSPLLGAYMPSFVAKALGTRASTTPQADDQWTGRPTFFDPENFRTDLEIVTVGNDELKHILQECRARDVKLTGLLHQVIVQAMSKELLPEKAGSFVTQTAIDLRANLNGLTADDMAICSNAYYELFPRTAQNTPERSSSSIDDSMWDAARATTKALAIKARTLDDQPVGLLRYLRSMYPWMRGQIGKPRESSYQLSNILSFNPGPFDPEHAWNIESMVFSQPACAMSAALSFNVVSRHGGNLTMVIGWKVGALDVEDEQAFVKRLSASIGASLKFLGRAL